MYDEYGIFQVCIDNEIFDEYRTQIDKKVLKPKYHLDRELRRKYTYLTKHQNFLRQTPKHKM